jgi:hypothetical protein
MKGRLIQQFARGLAVALVVGFVALAYISRPNQLTPAAGPASVPTSIGTIDPIGEQPCWDVHVQADLLPQTASMFALQSRFVGVGTFTEFGPSFWNTVHGGVPRSREESRDALILTEIVVEFQNQLRGRVDGVRLAIRGGDVGCSHMTYPGGPELMEGQRYLFFGSGPFDADGHYTMFAAWPVGNNDVAHTPRDGDIPVSGLGDILRAYPFHEDGSPVATAPPSEPPTVEGTPDTRP